MTSGLRFLFLVSVVLLRTLYIYADEEQKLSVTPSGRILIDGACFVSPQKSSFPDGMAIPEARLGVKMSYANWSSAIDVSYSYNKVGLRNVWIEYAFNRNNTLRIGNFVHQFGLQSTSQSLKCTMEQPLVSALFTPGLQLGAMYLHFSPRFYAAVSAHVESNALKEVMNRPLFIRQGVGVLSRLLWRNSPTEFSPILQTGLSLGVASPQKHIDDGIDVHDAFSMSANFPTKVVQTQAIGVTIDKARNLLKFSPELLLAYKKWAFESQYFFQSISRSSGLKPYIAQGAYATVRTLLSGSDYSYISATGQLACPGRRSLELVLNYNYADLPDRHAALSGGKSNSFSSTLNYYINPYITLRLNYSFTHTFGVPDNHPVNFNAIQARLMLLF